MEITFGEGYAFVKPILRGSASIIDCETIYLRAKASQVPSEGGAPSDPLACLFFK